jgi:hypothetical protein
MSLIEKNNTIFEYRINTIIYRLKSKGIKSIDQFLKTNLLDLIKKNVSKRNILNLLQFYKLSKSKYKPKSNIIKKFFYNIDGKIKGKKKLNVVIPKTVIKINSLSPINFKERGLKKSIIHQEIIQDKPNYQKKILISFGINSYQKWDILSNPINDVKSISSFFKDKLGFDHIYTYLDENVTKKSIEKIITHDLFKMVKEDDLVVMSFHGHGHSLSFTTFTEGFLVPYDANRIPTPFELISMNNLSKWFNYIKSRHVLLLLDCCFSGLSVLRSNYIQDELHTNAIKTHLKSSSRIIINAGTTDQSVSDGGWNNNSVFTGAIISSPTFNNNTGSVINLYYYLLSVIPRYSNQTPSIGKMEGDMGTDIFLKI